MRPSLPKSSPKERNVLQPDNPKKRAFAYGEEAGNGFAPVLHCHLQNPALMKKIFAIFILALTVWAYGTSCGRNGSMYKAACDAPYPEVAVPASDAGMLTGYEGTYTGSPPCFMGRITTEITLDDNRYLLKNRYILTNEEKGFIVQGEYTCSQDGGRIRLQGDASPTIYLIGKDVLIPLDEEGRPLDASGGLFCLERVALR